MATVTLTVEDHDGELWLMAINGSAAVKLAKFTDREKVEIFKECYAAAQAVSHARGALGI